MGKEWHWAGKSSKRNGVEAEAAETTPSGCMCAVFQFFDFRPFHFPTLNQQQQQHQQTSFKSPSCIPQDSITIPKGAEAPRNSLESVDGTVSSPSKEENFKIPKNIQIKTRGSTVANAGNLNDLSSPGAKTPTLVARLMGLELLPGLNSPTSSSCLSTPNSQGNVPHVHHLKLHKHIQTKPRNSTEYSGDHHISASRSLPETPRISSARRSDVDHHRLSLQIIKEKSMMSLGEDLELPRLSFSKKKCDENNSSRSPSQSARQIVKQVKDSLSRKVGQDITNTLKTRDQELVTQLRIKKSSKSSSLKALDESSPGKHSNLSHSPRLRFMDTKHKPSTTTTPSPHTTKDQNTNQPVLKLPPELPRVLTKPKHQAFPEQQELHNQKVSVPKCKKVTSEKFSSRFKRPPQTTDIIRNKQEEPFKFSPTSPIRANDIKNTKSKKTHPLSSNLLNNIINTVPNVLSVKTEPSPPATKIAQKQVSDAKESKHSSQLSSCARQRYKQEGTINTESTATRETTTSNEDKPNCASTSTAAEEYHKPEFQYITQILNRTINTEATTNTTKLVPLDPSIFHHLESQCDNKYHNYTPKNQLGHRWNRRLLFDLVDEVLDEILMPKGCKTNLWFLYRGRNVGELTESVWKRVEDFPRARCEVLEDIDALIEAEDMEKVKMEGEEEGERMVTEIEGNIWDTLVHETVMMMESGGVQHRDGVVL